MQELPHSTLKNTHNDLQWSTWGKKGKNMNESLVCFFLRIKAQLEILHWQTTSYARHMAYGRIYDALQELVDGFIEAYQGKYGRLSIEEAVIIRNIEDEELDSFIDDTITALNSEIPSMLDENDTNLLNIRDEILDQFNILKYLLSLN